jgi:hypothetical protein
MTLCPVALAAGCKKCAIVNICPLKGVIGDYKKGGDAGDKRPGSGGPRKPS